jgi:hypothetical protein
MSGRITGSIASNVSRVASPRRDDASWFSSIDDHSSRPFSGDRSQPAGFFGGEQSSESFSHRGSGGRRSLRHVAGLFPFHVFSGRRTDQQRFRTAGAALCDRSSNHAGNSQHSRPALPRTNVSAIATCGKQGRGFFDFSYQSIAAKLNSKPHQSLINPTVNGYLVFSLRQSLSIPIQPYADRQRKDFRRCKPGMSDHDAQIDPVVSPMACLFGFGRTQRVMMHSCPEDSQAALATQGVIAGKHDDGVFADEAIDDQFRQQTVTSP